MRRAGLSVLAAAVLLALPAAANAADVTVNFARGGGSKTLSLSSLTSNFDVSAQFKLVGASGQTTTKQINGISLRALLDSAGADPTYSAVEIARPGGGKVVVSRVQIEQGELPPVVYEDAGRTTFLRPWSGSGDQNVRDVVSASPLVISQVDGLNYGLKAKASTSKTKAGQRVSFSATASGAAGQKLEYTWVFADGTTATGAAVKHRFKKRGYYRVLVSVRGAGEAGSSSVVVPIQVGKPAKSDAKRTGAGTNDSAGAPVSGQADGGSGDGRSAGSSDAGRARPSTRRAPRRSTAGQASAEQTVTGELLTGAKVQTATPSALAARTGRAGKAQQSSGGVPGEAVGITVALGLLGLGAALEFGAAGRLRRRPV